MIKDIKYNGVTATPSDYECPDGDLTCAINLVPEEGEMQPIPLPQTLFTLPSTEYAVFFIHRGNGYINYILRHENVLYWISSSNANGTISNNDMKQLHAFTEIYGINAIGNTLIVLTSEGMQYLLWKDSSYTFLGTHIPELPISFSLQGEMERSDTFDISCDEIKVNFKFGTTTYQETTVITAIAEEFSDDNKKKITDQVLAKVNKFIADKSTNAGKFIFPFLVRYAYRLYDQSLIMHSAPVLMICASGVTPACIVKSVRYNESVANVAVIGATLRIAAMTHKLDYAVQNQSHINNLNSWKDIVKSVDIFVSKPIYTYNQNGECQKFIQGLGSQLYSVCKHNNQAIDTTRYPLQYQTATFSWLYAKTFDPTELKCPDVFLELPKRDEEAIKADITDKTQFYLLKSIPIDELKTDRTVIPIGKEYLQSLVNREVMTDDYDSHDTLMPKLSFAYNSRLNIANLTKRLFTGHNTYSLFQYTDGYVGNFSDASPTRFNNTKVSVQVFIYVRQDGKEFVLNGGTPATFGFKSKFIFLYHPNQYAYKALIKISQPFTKTYEVPLTPHPLLNGAYFYGDWTGIEQEANETNNAPYTTTNNTVRLPNKIYTSEVNNPFFFPALGINTVGTGTVYGICAAVKALSQGQFGQFPLYTFTDEGVWSLEVSNEGKYISKQPVTRDVCSNPDSITQTDSEVLFVSQRGIMLLSGANCICISDTLQSNETFDIGNLAGIHLLANYPTVKAALKMNVTFKDFIKQAKMLYDYTNQRIIVYNPDYEHNYVFSLKSKKWGTFAPGYKLITAINSYPDTLAMTGKATVVNMSQSETSEYTPIQTLIVTRPIKITEPYILKTVNAIIQRGNFHKNAVSQILYASRDLINWQLVSSSDEERLTGIYGTPYKYYRIVAFCNLFKKENIQGCTIQYVTKLTNKIR